MSNLKKYLSGENLKKLMPFIVVGLVLGVIVYLKNAITGSAATATTTTTTATDQTATDQTANLQEMAQETNQAFTEQKAYYDQKIAAMETATAQSNTDFQNKLSQDEGVIQQQQDQNNTLYTSVHDLLAANNNLTSLMDNLQGQVKQSSSQAAAAQTTAEQAAAQVRESAVKTSTTSSQPAISRVLKTGTSGADVKQLQQALNSKGAKIAVDGQFGAQTKQAVINYQRSQGIQVDGQVYTQTWSKLFG